MNSSYGSTNFTDIMTNFRSNISLTTPFISASRCYHIGTAQSVHSAIHRGLLKSRGLAFRGKTKPDPNEAREVYKRTHKLPDYSSIKRRNEYNGGPEYHKKHQDRKPDQPRWMVRGKVNKNTPNSNQSFQASNNENRASRSWKFQNSTNFLRRAMKVDMERQEDMERQGVMEKVEPELFDENLSSEKNSSNMDQYESFKRFSFNQNLASERSSRPEFQENRDRSEILQSSKFPEDDLLLNRKARRDLEFRGNKPKPLKGQKAKLASKQTKSSFGSPETDEEASTELRKSPEVNSSTQAPERYSRPFRMPISIPHKTAASQYLYGSSVVEAALRSSRIPSRKLYKLYIYSVPNRESAERDQVLKRLAKSKGVEIEYVHGNRICVLDKMSNGRPHNGYILEASPLPRLPVTCLKEVVGQNREDREKDEQMVGFKVNLEEQSREDAAINGNSDLVLTGNTSMKQPLVLLLDNIVDPANLGGIIRAGYFLGVAAIAISVNNSAPISPVVLKASAGASELMTLLSVRDPAEFLLNSKKAGWLIYAAVPPFSFNGSSKCQHITVDELAIQDSTTTSPSILIIGGEGEGIRRSSRNKADIEISIPRYQKLGVDSLNVAVATGIICNAFSQILHVKTASSYSISSMLSRNQKEREEKNWEEKGNEILF